MIDQLFGNAKRKPTMKSKISLLLVGLLLTSGCTIAINLTHTEGTASDIVDETQTNDPTVDPSLQVPAGVL
jgi:hypothetical protein